jgi:hypothetical protein
LQSLKIQIIRKNETEGLEYVQKHIDLGWKAISKFNLGTEVYFVNLIWDKDESPTYPRESPLGKNH